MTGQLMTITQAAEFLGISRYYIDAAVASGQLKSVTITGRVFLLRAEVETFVEREAK